MESAINLISCNVCLTGNLSSGYMSDDGQDFVILKKFLITRKHRKTSKIIEVNWHPLNCSWIEVNIDGSAKGAPGLAACGAIFRVSSASTLGCFAYHIGIANALRAELLGAIIAIELVYRIGWHMIWLECDSKMVVLS